MCCPVDFKKVPCRTLLRPEKGRVTVSILGVYTHFCDTTLKFDVNNSKFCRSPITSLYLLPLPETIADTFPDWWLSSNDVFSQVEPPLLNNTYIFLYFIHCSYSFLWAVLDLTYSFISYTGYSHKDQLGPYVM